MLALQIVSQFRKNKVNFQFPEQLANVCSKAAIPYTSHSPEQLGSDKRTAFPTTMSTEAAGFWNSKLCS